MTFQPDFLKHHQHLLNRLPLCTTLHSLKTTKSLHALAVTLGTFPHDQSTFIYNNIISLYASLDALPLAQQVFQSMPQRNKVSYNSMITWRSRNGHLEEAWHGFREMRYRGFTPNNFTLASILSCAPLDVDRAMQLQALGVKNGLLSSDAFVGTALLGLFGRCGMLDEVWRVFEDMSCKSSVTWNSMISLLGDYGFGEDCMILFRELVRKVGSLSKYTFGGALSGLLCNQYLEYGEQIHGLAVKHGLHSEILVVNSLINMYAKCGSMNLMLKVFEEAGSSDVVTWNTVIGALVKSSEPGKALDLFLRISKDRIVSNQTTFVSAVNSCTSLQILLYGEFVHAKVIKNSFETDAYVGSALVDYYGKCNKLDDAHRCFVEIYEKNTVCWNALILGYANKCSSTSISLLLEMLDFGYQPNEFSFSAVLKASTELELKQLHCLITRMGYENNKYVLSSLITSYGRNNLISDALVFLKALETSLDVVPSNNIAGIYNRAGQYQETLKLLSQVEEPDITSWNIAIAACARNGNDKEVLELFNHMLTARIHPDNYTYVSILSVCSKRCNFALGSSIHGLLMKMNFSCCDVFVCNVLMDMYGKCGSLRSSIKIFDGMTKRNLITWTILISTLGINGCCHEALEKFKEMELLGFRPDSVAFMAALTACRHGALIREGIDMFEKMVVYGVEPELGHYHAIVDLLARNGHLQQAEKVISSMPFSPDAVIWRTFLEGCKIYRSTEYEAAVM